MVSLPLNNEPEHPHRAPLIIFGCIFAIGGIGLGVVLVSHLRRTEPLMEPSFMAPQNPNRVDNPIHHVPKPGSQKFSPAKEKSPL